MTASSGMLRYQWPSSGSSLTPAMTEYRLDHHQLVPTHDAMKLQMHHARSDLQTSPTDRCVVAVCR